MKTNNPKTFIFDGQEKQAEFIAPVLTFGCYINENETAQKVNANIRLKYYAKNEQGEAIIPTIDQVDNVVLTYFDLLNTTDTNVGKCIQQVEAALQELINALNL
jgi:hypothetical protein